jgi:anti-sigma B factor antagonist
VFFSFVNSVIVGTIPDQRTGTFLLYKKSYPRSAGSYTAPAKLAMETTITKEKNTTIFALNGRLDSNSAPQFEHQLQDFITTPCTHLVFDFNNLDYISSAGLRVVLNTAKAYKSGKFLFITCAMQEHVQEVFEISGFDSFITIHRSVDESLSVLQD